MESLKEVEAKEPPPSLDALWILGLTATSGFKMLTPYQRNLLVTLQSLGYKKTLKAFRIGQKAYKAYMEDIRQILKGEKSFE
jgi:hypothetical protein